MGPSDPIPDPLAHWPRVRVDPIYIRAEQGQRYWCGVARNRTSDRQGFGDADLSVATSGVRKAFTGSADRILSPEPTFAAHPLSVRHLITW